MKNIQQTLNNSPTGPHKSKGENAARSKLRLTEVERLIRSHRIIVPPPARRTLSNMCEQGIFETVGAAPTKLGWLVYEDSFWRWVNGLDEDEITG